MADKYQVLEEGKNNAVIERVDPPANASDKRVPKWRVVVPDAGDSNRAIQVARLLNKEHQEVLDRRSGRESDDIHE